jgi:hypothetical protein
LCSSSFGAGVRCRCGECEIRFAGSKSAVLRVDCCCIDCRRAAVWSTQHGGTASDTLPCDLTYWANDLVVVKGNSKLQATALGATYLSTRVTAICCNTNLLVDHPGYGGNVVMTLREVLVDAELPPTAIRINLQDVPDALRAALPPTASGVPNLENTDNPDTKDVVGPVFLPLRTRHVQERRGIGVGQLLEGLGAVRVLNVDVLIPGEPASEHMQQLVDGDGGYDARIRAKVSPTMRKPK